jgi:hypothetical protein
MLRIKIDVVHIAPFVGLSCFIDENDKLVNGNSSIGVGFHVLGFGSARKRCGKFQDV